MLEGEIRVKFASGRCTRGSACKDGLHIIEQLLADYGRVQSPNPLERLVAGQRDPPGVKGILQQLVKSLRGKRLPLAVLNPSSEMIAKIAVFLYCPVAISSKALRTRGAARSSGTMLGPSFPPIFWKPIGARHGKRPAATDWRVRSRIFSDNASLKY